MAKSILTELLEATSFGKAIKEVRAERAKIYELQGLQNQLATMESKPAPLPKDLPNALLTLRTDQVMDVTKWMQGLQYEHKVEISKWSLEDLNKLFALEPEARTSIISTITGPTIVEQILGIEKWRQANEQEFDPETKAILQEWENWADDVLAKDK